MGSTDVRRRLGDFVAALREKDWGRVEELLADDTSWYVGGTSSLAGQYDLIVHWPRPSEPHRGDQGPSRRR